MVKKGVIDPSLHGFWVIDRLNIRDNITAMPCARAPAPASPGGFDSHNSAVRGSIRIRHIFGSVGPLGHHTTFAKPPSSLLHHA
jgi:hypothetical protein